MLLIAEAAFLIIHIILSHFLSVEERHYTDKH